MSMLLVQIEKMKHEDGLLLGDYLSLARHSDNGSRPGRRRRHRTFFVLERAGGGRSRIT